MKILLIFLCIFFSLIVCATEKKKENIKNKSFIVHEICTGSLSFHFLQNKKSTSRYANKLNSNGMLISNFIVGYSHVKVNNQMSFNSYTYFTGVDSVETPTIGFMYGYGLSKFVKKGITTELIGGTYIFNYQAWEDRKIRPFAIHFGKFGFVPVIGIKTSYKWKLTKTKFIKLSLAIMPGLLNTHISFGWR